MISRRQKTGLGNVHTKRDVKNDMKTISDNTVHQLNARNRAASDGRRDLKITEPLIRDDGYFTLADTGQKGKQDLLLPPTNSWPLRRKIGAREFKEYGDKLDSGSETFTETRPEERRSRNSIRTNSGASLLIELQNADPKLDRSECVSSLRNCVDYCTCMLCVKSAYYVCCDAEDDTGTQGYDPCYCGKPSRGCLKRWGCLGLLAFFVPCIVCYPVANRCVTRYEHSKRSRDKAKRKRFKIRFKKNQEEENNS
eukprot:gene12200-2822_t